MSNFINLTNEILEEQGKTLQDLFDANIVPENTFYKYKRRYPNLRTLINIVNYLEVSIDYFFDIDSVNHFKPYPKEQKCFYENLNYILDINKISQTKFCEDLNFSRANLWRWKRGISPRVENLIAIMKYLDCSASELLIDRK